MSVTLPIYNLDGKKTSEFSYVPFGEKLSEQMLAQIMRVYTTNQHQGTKQAKTRGEVSRPDTKPWRQKGTGRARHGSKNSPIWVGGGVTFGPRPHTRRLTLSKQLRQKAMRYFLDTEVAEGSVVVLREADSQAKTKEAVAFVEKLNAFKLPVFVVLHEKDDRNAAAFRNISDVVIRRGNLLSPLDMSKKALFIFAEGALQGLVDRVKKHD